MIELSRSKHNKWIMQKNVSSKKLIEAYLTIVQDLSEYDPQELLERLFDEGAYQGRSLTGSIRTMGVRFSQLNFYMFGHKSPGHRFVPTPMTINLSKGESVKKNMLVNLFSLQYPHPYSNTPANFEILAGRLIIQLLIDPRIDKKLYIDELVYFIPFIEKINSSKYNELIDSIIEFRQLSYADKLNLFTSVDDYTDIFSNCLHEFNYYFLRIYQQFGVFELIGDQNHNDGQLLKFQHGNTQTFRTDAYKSNARYSGYVALNEELIDDARKLINNYSAFEVPLLKSDFDQTNESWITDIYELQPLNYLGLIEPQTTAKAEVMNIINNMTYMSKFSGLDGKDFEYSLKEFFELFKEAINVEIISGSGDTDVLCLMDKVITEETYKVNVDGKSRSSANSLNPARLRRHITLNGSDYCIVVAPKFSRGTILDVDGYDIVTIKAEVLAEYCLKECLSNASLDADFTSLDSIIRNNLGTDISKQIYDLIDSRYGIVI